MNAPAVSRVKALVALALFLALLVACTSMSATATPERTSTPQQTNTARPTDAPALTVTPEQAETPVSSNTPVLAITPRALPTIQPRPPFIHWVTPEESSSVPLSLYVREFGEHNPFPGPEFGYSSKICAELHVYDLVQKGDDFTDAEQVLNRTALEVDGVTRLGDGLITIKNLTEWVENGKTVAQWGGPFSFCWEAPLGIGTHQVSFEFLLTSGDMEEYSWQFEIR